MFRKTLITATIAAAAFFALGSAAPASANDFQCLFSPLGCDFNGLFDGGESPDAADAASDPVIVAELSPDVLAAILEGPSIDLPDVDVPELAVPGPTDEVPAEEPAEPIEESTTTVDEPVAPVDETTTTTTAPHEDAPVVEPSPSSFEEVAAATTTTVGTHDVEDDSTSDQMADAALPSTGTAAAQGSSFNPMMAALAGALGALAVALLTLTAFAAGRRPS